LSAFRNVHHKGSKNFYLPSCASTSKEKPNTTIESLELTIIWQRWADIDFFAIRSYPVFKKGIRIQSDSCFDWNHAMRIRKLSESALWCTTYCALSILPHDAK